MEQSAMHPPRRVFLVFCDHSVLGVWRSKRAAKAAARARSDESILEVEYHVVGPYVLEGGVA
jgi:hypothetical protein